MMVQRRRRQRIPLNSRLHTVIEYALLILGSMVVALAFNMLLSPNRIASGGVSGISIIVRHYTDITPAYTQWALNLPLFLAGWRLLGGRFGLKTLLGSVLLPLFVLMTDGMEPLTENVLLASVFGGMGIGIGIGLVFRGRGSTGGLDLAAQILHKYSGLSLGMCIALLDGIVITAAGIAFTPEIAMYALIGLFVTSRTIDVMQVGFAHSKVAYIISEKPEDIRKAVLYELDRGLTVLQGKGGYSGEERNVLMVVVKLNEVPRLKGLVRSVDESAFVIISDAFEVLGEGFKLE